MKIYKGLERLKKTLRKVNINKIIENANNINVEDLKNISLKDIKRFISSPLMIPIISMTSTIGLIIFLLNPSINKFTSIKSKVNKYSAESNENQNLSVKINKLKSFEADIIGEFSPINNSVLLNNRLIFITEILNQISLRSKVQVTSFQPIQSQQKDSCIALSPEEVNLLRAQNNQYMKSEDSLKTSGSKRKRITPLQANIPSNHKENYYRLELKGNYMRVINFINYLQEYDVIIVPNCFRSEGLMGSSGINNTGDITAEFIFNVPSRALEG